ncbi:MAG: hypothetical protein FJ253_01270 [Phycisphaerae bacterium]|nr:hypothetical protein [Phycisphaerae bacterium]
MVLATFSARAQVAPPQDATHSKPAAEAVLSEPIGFDRAHLATGLDEDRDQRETAFGGGDIPMEQQLGPGNWFVVEVTNTTGQAAADLHITFTGSGGILFVPPGFVMAPGCPNPVVPSNGQLTNTVIIDWNAACVPPGGRVIFLVNTLFGPLGFAGGFWTDINGANIGNIGAGFITVRAVPLGGGPLIPPTKPWIAIKRQIAYIGIPVYGPWAKPPGQCWQRWCCFDTNQLCCFDRWLFCRFPDRFSRFFELIGPGLGNCFVIRGWRLFFKNTEGPVWFLQITTIPPPPWEPQQPPGGPPPQKPLFAAQHPETVQRQLEIWDSDDQGASSNGSADVSSCFFDINAALTIPTTNPLLPPIIGFPNIAMAMAPRYNEARQAMIPIEIVALHLQSTNPLPIWDNLVINIQAMKNDLGQMAAGLGTGLPVDPTPYFDFANRANSMGSAMAGATGSLRYQTVREYLASIAEGMNTSGMAILTGLPTPVEQDKYLWGQVGRFHPMSHFVGAAAGPHMRVKLDLMLNSWGPQTGVVEVIARDADSPRSHALLHATQPINEYGDVILDGFDLEGTKTIAAWSKGPTNLATTVVAPYMDGGTFVPESIQQNGDADGNNCVDMNDANYVMSTMGQGGEFAPMVPSSDVNRDGVVSFADLAIVQSAIGKCGDPEPWACLADFNNDDQVDGNDLGTLLGEWGPCPGCQADLNEDGVVDGDDLGSLLGVWGPCPDFV